MICTKWIFYQVAAIVAQIIRVKVFIIVVRWERATWACQAHLAMVLSILYVLLRFCGFISIHEGRDYSTAFTLEHPVNLVGTQSRIPDERYRTDFDCAWFRTVHDFVLCMISDWSWYRNLWYLTEDDGVQPYVGYEIKGTVAWDLYVLFLAWMDLSRPE